MWCSWLLFDQTRPADLNTTRLKMTKQLNHNITLKCLVFCEFKNFSNMKSIKLNKCVWLSKWTLFSNIRLTIAIFLNSCSRPWFVYLAVFTFFPLMLILYIYIYIYCYQYIYIVINIIIKQMIYHFKALYTCISIEIIFVNSLFWYKYGYFTIQCVFFVET